MERLSPLTLVLLVTLHCLQYINNFYPQEEKEMMHDAFSGYQAEFLIGIGLSLLGGFLIGAERESRGNLLG